MNRGPVLSVKGLSIVKGSREILRAPELSVNQGEFVAVTGPNGSGKSTLLKALCFLEDLSAGEIIFQGRPVAGRQQIFQARRKMAMVFQDPLLLKGTVLENVTVGLKLRGVARQTRNEQAMYWLAKLGISALAHRQAQTLSGGEAQRVSLARAMVLEPEVLFLDEPFSSLDMPTTALLMGELKEILCETGTTTFMVTHELADVSYLAERMMVLLDGEIKQDGLVEEVLQWPVTSEVARFLGVENIWPGNISRKDHRQLDFRLAESGLTLTMMADTAGARPRTPDNLCAYIRPENVLVNDRIFTCPNVLTGQIAGVYPYQFSYRLQIKAAGETTTPVEITAIVPAIQFLSPPRKGEQVQVTLPPERIGLLHQRK